MTTIPFTDENLNSLLKDDLITVAQIVLNDIPVFEIFISESDEEKFCEVIQLYSDVLYFASSKLDIKFFNDILDNYPCGRVNKIKL